jgi:hypothetical protein
MRCVISRGIQFPIQTFPDSFKRERGRMLLITMHPQLQRRKRLQVFRRRIKPPFPGRFGVITNDGIPGIDAALVVKELKFPVPGFIHRVYTLHKRQDITLLMRIGGDRFTDGDYFTQNKGGLILLIYGSVSLLKIMPPPVTP